MGRKERSRIVVLKLLHIRIPWKLLKIFIVSPHTLDQNLLSGESWGAQTSVLFKIPQVIPMHSKVEKHSLRGKRPIAQESDSSS